jgi:hypothetical protein
MRVIDRKLLVGAALAVVVAALLLLRSGASEAPIAASPALDPVADASPAVSSAPPPARPRPAAESPALAPVEDPAIAARMALVESDPVLMDRARQQELAPAADARWSDAVDRAGYTREDVDPAVRESLRLVELEPRYAEEGMIDGLTIRSLPADHPFARAGFRAGDRLSRIEGVLLHDPSELPALFTRLGPRFEVCAWEGEGRESCGIVVVD